MPKIRLMLAVLLLMPGASGAIAQVYKWVDEDGVVHYSDQPHPGAEEFELPKQRTPVPDARPAVPQPSRGTESDAPQPAAPDAPFSYESLSFTSPEPEQTLWNIGGVLNVTLNVQPALQSGDRVRVYFDGEGQEVSGLSFQLEEVWRGTHNLQAEIVDQDGQVMIRTEPMQFYVQQTSILNP